MLSFQNENIITYCMEIKNYEFWMKKAIELAQKSYEQNEVPVGTLIIKNNHVVGRGWNLMNSTNIATNHAEIMAINMASQELNNWRLLDCEIYVTLEPCLMCVGAINNCRIKKVIYGARNNNFGAINMIRPKIEVISGILQFECSKMLSNFFKKIRGIAEAHRIL